MERVRRTRADAVGSDEVAGAAGRPVVVYNECRAAACQRRASVLQHAHEISTRRHLGAWRPGGLPFEDLRRHLARRQPGYVDSKLLALRYLRGSQDRQELEG